MNISNKTQSQLCQHNGHRSEKYNTQFRPVNPTRNHRQTTTSEIPIRVTDALCFEFIETKENASQGAPRPRPKPPLCKKK